MKQIKWILCVACIMALVCTHAARASSAWNVTGADGIANTATKVQSDYTVILHPIKVLGILMTATATASSVQLYDAPNGGQHGATNAVTPVLRAAANTTVYFDLNNLYITGNLYAGAIHDSGTFVYVE